MAIGQSRRAAKQERRTAGEKLWTFSTGRIHSHKTRTTYQEHVLRFVNAMRAEHHIKRLVDLDARANELSSEYLRQQIAAGKSPYTLAVIRSALRLFFGNNQIASDVPLPKRERTKITRSRQAVKHDRHFQPANWQPLLNFLNATGLRRDEARDLKVKDIYQDHAGTVFVHIECGKGGLQREVPVLPGREADVLSVVRGRDPEEHTFSRIPKHLDVHSYRRLFAQAMYLYYAPGRTLPPAEGRLKRSDYDRAAAERVTWALGHSRIDVILNHYIR
jgi:integrase